MRKAAAERLEATKERVLLELCRLAYIDPRKLFDGRNKLKAIAKLDADTARAIKSISFGDFGNVEAIRLVDKKGALDSIAKHLGMFKELHEVAGPNGGPIPHKHEIVFVRAPAEAAPPAAAPPPQPDEETLDP